MDASADWNRLEAVLEREARRLTGDSDEAEDLAQEVRLIVHGRGDTIRDATKTAAWCLTVLRNVWRGRLRRRWYSERLGLDDLPEPVTDPWEAVEARLVVEQAVGELPPTVARAVREFYLAGATVATIAAGEARPEGTIKRWLHEGREALRMSLADLAPDAPVARVYASNWMDDARRNVTQALREAGYRSEWGELGEEDPLPADAALLVLGEQAGSRSGLELLLAVRGTPGIASTPVVLFGPGRESAVLAAWKAGADCYLTDPSSPEVVQFLRKLRTMA